MRRSSTAVAASGLCTLVVAMGIGRFAFAPLLPMMQDDAGLSLAQAGYLASANYVGYFAGALSATRPVRPALAIRVALVSIALSTLAMGLVHGLLAWSCLRLIAGIGSAWALVYGSAWWLSRVERPLLAGVVFSGVGWGIVLTGSICAALTALGATSSQTWIALGLVSLASTALIWPTLDGATARTASRSMKPALQSREAWRLVLCYGAFGFAYIIPATFVPAMAKAAFGGAAAFSLAWPLFGATSALSTLVASGALAHAGNRRAWIAAALVMAAGVAAPLVLGGAAGVVAAALLVGSTFMVVTMTGMQEARRVAGPAAAPLMAAMTSAFAAGQIAGPLTVSWLANTRAGVEGALALASVLLVASAFALAAREKP